MTVKEFIKQLQSINKDEVIVSIGAYGGVNRPAEYCIHTDKGKYDIGKEGGKANGNDTL